MSSLIPFLRIKALHSKKNAKVVHTITDNKVVWWVIALPADSLSGLDPHHASQRSSDRACSSAGLAFASPSAAEAEVVREEYMEEVPAIDAPSLSIVRK